MAEIEAKEVEAMTVMSLAFTGPYEQTQDQVGELMSWLLRAGHPYSSPPLGLYYDDPSKVAADELRAEVCVPIEEECAPADDVQRKELPAVTVACAVHTGPYSEVGQLYEEILNWITENGYRCIEDQPAREVFHQIYGQVESPEEYVTEVQVPVEKA